MIRAKKQNVNLCELKCKEFFDIHFVDIEQKIRTNEYKNLKEYTDEMAKFIDNFHKNGPAGTGRERHL